MFIKQSIHLYPRYSVQCVYKIYISYICSVCVCVYIYMYIYIYIKQCANRELSGLPCKISRSSEWRVYSLKGWGSTDGTRVSGVTGTKKHEASLQTGQLVDNIHITWLVSRSKVLNIFYSNMITCHIYVCVCVCVCALSWILVMI